VTEDATTLALIEWIVTPGTLAGTAICSPTWLPLLPFSVTTPACSLVKT